jgi:hypothetical protein
VRPSRYPPGRRQVAEVLARERTQVSHGHQDSGYRFAWKAALQDIFP